MILLGSTIISTPVVSIQTGAVIAEVVRAIVDPAQLNIVAYEVKGPLITKKPAYLRVADIREISDIGAMIFQKSSDRSHDTRSIRTTNEESRNMLKL